MTPSVEDAILEKSPIRRVENNLAAIRLLQKLKERDFRATPAEQNILAKYVGWGGLSEIFSHDYERAYEMERHGDAAHAEGRAKSAKYGLEGYAAFREIRETLNDEEYRAARETVLTAFYTPIRMVRAEHDALRRLGVLGGRFLGPSAGVGNYASAAGDYLKGASWQFVEKDRVSGQILRALFPNQRVHVGGFEETTLADSFFDFAIDNVPYGDFTVADRKFRDGSGMRIHDYFFAKALSKIRPGGVMMFLTSTGTLDKTDGRLRQFLSRNGGRIVGAVRLPNGFFSRNAGTDVASDLVVIQRVPGEADNRAFMERQKFGEATEWQGRRGQVQVDLTYNRYFADNPGQVIGEMTVGSGQYGRPTLKYAMPTGDVFAQVSDAIDRALAGVDRDALMKNAPKARQVEHAPVYDGEGLRQGNVTVRDGKVYEKSGDGLVEVPMPKLSKRQRNSLALRGLTPGKVVERMLDVRKALRAVVDAEVGGVDDAALQPLLDGLNESYDGFVEKVGSFHDRNVTPFVMMDKADGNRLMTMERVVKTEAGDRIEKADILRKRVIFRDQKPTSADNASDALTIAYGETGALDLGRVAELLGVDGEEAARRLKAERLAFENPQTGMLEPHWVYLSGRVRRKLEAARAAMQNDPAFAGNVEALEKVQPKDVPLDEVSIKFGAVWADAESMQDFLDEAYDLRGYARARLAKNPVTGKWKLELPRGETRPFGETSFTQEHFVEAVLNSESIEVREKDPVTGKYYVLERETEAQKLAAEKLHEAFARYLRTSEKWFEPSQESFNMMMNDNVPMELPKDILPFRAAGMSEDVIGKLHAEGREYQPAVIARGVLGGTSLCLAHCVGAGKTLEMQSIGMIGRHLGMFRKSMYVVPNHMLDQFCNEFIAAFPNANILKMSTEDVRPKNRRAFFAKVANGDWDAIVVKHSTFSTKLPMTEAWQRDFINREIERLKDAKLAAKGDRGTVKDIEKLIKDAQEKIRKLDNSAGKDAEIVPFEELGVDQLFVDEAHNFKGLPVVSSQARKVKGLQQGDSQRALDMEMKTQYVQSLHGGRRGIVFATGTPLSNAPVVEAYVQLRYLAPWALEEQGIRNFDDFVNTFGRIETVSEFGDDGRSVKEVRRVTAFVNIPEMMRLFKSVVDIVNSDQIRVRRPKRVLEAVPVPMSGAQAAVMEMVARESAIPPTREERGKFLALSGIAKRVCISPRLVGIADDGNKMAAAADRIKRVYDETADRRGSQLVFTDIFNGSDAKGVQTYVGGIGGVEHTDAPFNLNVRLKELLVAGGIPAEQIAIIHDVDRAKGGDEGKDAAKEAIFEKVRSGEIRVLIGSRPRMGEGTNVQERLAAIHLLHPGWKPSEDVQAIGRIIRPGNTYETGRVFYYLTQGNGNVGSYETKNHELIGVKDRLIQAIMHGDETIREMDMDEAAAERDMLMGLASANQDLIRLIDVKRVLHKAELNAESVGYSARVSADRAERLARQLEERKRTFAEQERGAREWRERNPDGRFVMTTADGRALESVKEMAEHVGAEVAKQLAKERYERDGRLEIANFGGVPMILSYDYGQDRVSLAVPSIGYAKEIPYSGFIADFSPQAMTAVKSRILGEVSPDSEDAHRRIVADTEHQIARLKEDAKRFGGEWEAEKGKLAGLRTERARLERAVTPLIVQTTADRGVSAYGNWIIRKDGAGYAAARASDGAERRAASVRELIPLMDEADFASPMRAEGRTVDLRQRLGANDGGGTASVESLPVGDVDFDTPEFEVRVPFEFNVFGPSGREYHRTLAKSSAKAIQNVKHQYLFPEGVEKGHRLTYREKMILSQLDVQPVSVNRARPKNAIIINSNERKKWFHDLIKRNFNTDGSRRTNGGAPVVSRTDAEGGVGLGRRGSNGRGSAANRNVAGATSASGLAGHPDNADRGADTGRHPAPEVRRQMTFGDLGGIDFDTPEFDSASREYDGVVARFTNPNGTRKPGWMKAPNGRPTNLTERQWVQVRTPSFKRWFGDWEKSATLSAIEGMPSVKIEGGGNGIDAKAAYSALENGKNAIDGREVRFVNATLGKILRHRGYDTARLVPHLKVVFDAAIPLGFETERMMPMRGDGTPHKEHRNFVGYHSYLGKIDDGGKKYFVRFTVQELRTRSKSFVPNELHSTFVSDVELYSEADLLALDTAKGAGKVGAVGLTDGILAKYLAEFKGAREDSSKVVDANGEPLVVYHGTPNDFTAFRRDFLGSTTRGAGTEWGFYFSDSEDLARAVVEDSSGREAKVIECYLNILNPLRVDLRDYDGDLDAALEQLQDSDYDGAVISGLVDHGIESENFLVLDGKQVKSATENTGAFDAANPDIRFDSPELDPEARAREIASFTERYYSRQRGLQRLAKPSASDVMDAAEGRWAKFRRIVQDKNLVIREVEERLGVTDKRESVYYAKDREFGLNEYQLGELQRRRVDPILDRLAETGASQRDFDLYLIARHAPYRNAVLRERGVTDGAGMSNAEAAEVIEGFNRLGVGDEFAAIADMVYAMNDEALQRRVDSGRVSPEEAETLRRTLVDYVPLRTDMENDERDAHNTYSSGWHQSEFQMARGRRTLADSPLAWSIVQAERSIRDANANRVRQTAAALVRKSAAMGKPIGEIIPGTQVRRRWAFNIGGEVLTLEELRDRTDLIFFKEDGKLKAIRMNVGANSLGNTFAKAVTDKDLVKFSKWFEWIPRLTRAMSAMRTQYVPTFIVRNLKADHIEVLLNVGSERGIVGGAKFFGRLVANEWRNRRDVRDYFRDGELRGRMKEFVENGGLTGGGMAAEGFSEAARRVDHTLRTTRGGVARKVAAAIPDAISLLNACAEFNTRVGVFSALRDEGVGVEDAVSYARDATVNFNRRGSLTPYLNAAFMFSNAAIQGLGRAFKSMRSEHGKQMVTLLFLVGFLQSLLDHFLGRDEDREKEGLSSARNLSEHEKQSTVGVPLPGGLRLKMQIRNPWALPMYAGRKAGELLMGWIDGKTAVADLASAAGGFVTEPVGGNGFGSVPEAMQTFAPTLLDPFVQWATGVDFKGDRRLRKNYSDNLPDSWNGRANTPDVYKWISQGLNAISGGSRFRKGAFDTSPENWQLLAETVLGGALADLNRAGSTVNDARLAALGAKPEQVLRDVPFVRDTLTNLPDVSSRYYDALSDYEADRTEYSGLARTDAGKAEAFATSHPWAVGSKNPVVGIVWNLGRAVQEAETPSDAAKLRREQLAEMAGFVRRMEEARKAGKRKVNR